MNQLRGNFKEIENLSNLKKNKDWINDAIERFGMFISEKYDSIEQFFEENSEKGLGKFKFEDFLNYHNNNYELFNCTIEFTYINTEPDYTTFENLSEKIENMHECENCKDIQIKKFTK